ncbi:hypothetical protein A2872_00130 [Candidatus Gottesmanbacteria bacterium RIFCSPHIGHO2_01_FULL_42_12]|uniref:Uncharacterized protein n=1 Tax=Candidatus Gottesmanbacteria bacterium RIFCSPHIGHO2_01_FULL_42_12 TaxID=1798377 RepID=A0A1F5Z3P7_9BACT|nr:MAG: hypothetical protein A2872_00130 [Candidatus Gottesmanbacteria bacterium RIFCSPHIGHO2_01_FULL_42_12]
MEGVKAHLAPKNFVASSATKPPQRELANPPSTDLANVDVSKAFRFQGILFFDVRGSFLEADKQIQLKQSWSVLCPT